jgi:NADPH-dependent glutamate synthase beta subunit-like oxidoreductase
LVIIFFSRRLWPANQVAEKKMTIDKSNKPKPIYVHRLPSCNNACPSGQNIQKWLAFVKESKYLEAWETIMQDNPIPATIGRVCYHPCESSCNRRGFDSSININAVERFLGDMALTEGWKVKQHAQKSGKKIMIIGAGPAGLSAAYHLCLLGHDVTIFEEAKFGGGTMHTGIPAYRLPRDILDAEVKRIEDMGVKIVYNHKVEDIEKEKTAGNFDAVFVAVGAQLGKGTNIPKIGNACAIIDSLDFLRDIEHNRAPKIAGQNILVYGGGNTAIDAARLAIRLGAESVEIVYRRNREKMPAFDFEIAEAEEEGVTFRLLRTIKEVNDRDVTLDIMELNTEGWPVGTGETEIIQADTIILALGLNVDTKFVHQISGIQFKSDDTIIVDEHMMTGAPGVFAGGDVIPYDRSVTTAIGHGKKAARNIDAFLKGEVYTKPEKHELGSADKLYTYFYKKADRKERSQLHFPERIETFDEVVHGLEEGDVKHEADRCFSCGNCFECDTCFTVCPVKAITKLGPHKGYHIDDEVCIRCGLCVRKCPCGSMKMVEDK